MQERFESLALSEPLESVFARLELITERTNNAVKALAAELRKFVTAVQKGNIANLRKAREGLRVRIVELTEAVKAVEDTDVEAIAREIGSQNYLNEILGEASRLGLQDLRIVRNAILSYPHRVLFESATTYRLGYRTASDLRPSVIAKALKDEREKASAIAPSFLESLRSAYLLLSKGQSGISVTLSEIYGALTMLQPVKKTYSEAEFIRDIAILDQLGPKITKDGYLVSFPASTSARSNRGYTAVNAKGFEVPYASIRFDTEATR